MYGTFVIFIFLWFSYLACFNDCDKTKMISECGLNAYNVLMGLYAKALKVSEELFASIGMEFELPRQCKRIGPVIDDDNSDDD